MHAFAFTFILSPYYPMNDVLRLAVHEPGRRITSRARPALASDVIVGALIGGETVLVSFNLL